MKKMRSACLFLADKQGAVAVYTAVILVVLLGFGALSVDVGHLYGVRNELNNAADAAALAGASVLLDSTGNVTEITIQNAKEEARRVGESNPTGSTNISIDLNADVQVGHWSFTTKSFSKNEIPDTSLADNWWVNVSTKDLDTDIRFINAVRVVPKRDDTPSFLARILGIEQFFVNSEAVAYIGFAGKLYPGDLDQPIAICKHAITRNDGDGLTCNVGRMSDGSKKLASFETAMWTNFTQPCTTANADDMKNLTDKCSGNSETTVLFGQGIGTVNGVQDPVLRNIETCWKKAAASDENGIADTFWPLTLPVVECGTSNTCAKLVGAVEVNVAWINIQNDPQYNEVPRKMEDWTCNGPGETCWESFVQHFNLENLDGSPAPYDHHTIYFLPSCNDHEPVGNTGGENFGIRAKIPVLVD